MAESVPEMRSSLTSFAHKLCALLAFSVVARFAISSRTEDLVRRWAPLIWLAPGEKFMPDSIEAFLRNTQLGDLYGRAANSIEGGEDSGKMYLHTLTDINELLANETTSFLNGRDPSQHPVPVYALVSKCSEHSFHVTYWLFFPYSLGKEFCVLGSIPLPPLFASCLGTRMLLGSHVGDFEHLSMSFGADTSYPLQIYLGTHESGVYYSLNRTSHSFVYTEQIKRRFLAPKPSFPNEIRIQRRRIQVFASLGSHGLWATAGTHSYHRFLGIEDVSGYGSAWRTWEDLRIFHVDAESHARQERDLPSWMRYEGHWGNPRSNCLVWRYFCAISDGPPGVLRPVKDFYCDNVSSQ